ERDLLVAVADPDSVRKLKPVSWDDVGSVVYIPRWQAFVREHAGAFAGVTPAALATLDWKALGGKLAARAKAQPGSGPAMADYGVGAGLTLALLKRGFVLEAPPGAPTQPAPGRAEPGAFFDPHARGHRPRRGRALAGVLRRRRHRGAGSRKRRLTASAGFQAACHCALAHCDVA